MSKNILIIKLSALGDIVQALDALQGLDLPAGAHRFSWAVAAGLEPLLENEARVDEIITVPRRWSLTGYLDYRRAMAGRSFDMVVDLQCLLKSWLAGLAVRKGETVTFGADHSRDWLAPRLASRTLSHESTNSREAYARLLAFALGVDAGAGGSGKSMLKRLPPRVPQVICLAPGAGWPTKRLDGARWGELAGLVRAAHPQARLEWLWGNQTEKDWLERHASLWTGVGSMMLPAMPLRELKRYLRAVDLFIGMDSGPTHLAAHVGASVLMFYGASSPGYYGPAGSAGFRGTCHLGVDFKDRCPRLRTCSTCSAMESIDIRQAWTDYMQKSN